jgi:hypothetical protein
MSSQDPDRLIVLGDGYPDWMTAVTQEGGIYRYVLLVIVSALLAFYRELASFVYRTGYWLAVWPTRQLFGAVAGVGRPFWWLLDRLEGFQATIETAASSAGLAGPFVALVTWLIPAILVIAIVNVLVGVASTYLPLEAIPILGRWFQ